MNFVLYIHPRCSTCKNALQFIEKSRLNPIIKDITITSPTIKELEAMLLFQKGEIRKLFNTSGELYRELGLKDKLSQMSQKDLFKLLTTHGMLVKRPFLLGKDIGLIGFRENEWEILIKQVI